MPHKILDAPCTSQVTGLLLQPGSRVEAIRWHLAGTMASLEEAARAFQPDILISVYYRKIIPQAILDIPPKVTYPNGSASGLRTRPHAACGRMRTARFAHLHTPFSCCSRCTEPEWLCGPTCQPHAALRPCSQHPDAFRSAANLHLAIRNGARMRVRASALPMLIDLIVLLLVFWVRVRGTFTRRCCRGTEAASPTFGRS
jgi:hypothetical protein